MQTKDIKKVVLNVISDEAHGTEFYTQKMYNFLCKKVAEIVEELNLLNITNAKKIERVNDYMIEHVTIRSQYFDAFREAIPKIPRSELIYRTAYAALVLGEAACPGFTEAVRILLEASGMKTYTLLTKLPGHNKRLLHYVAIIKHPTVKGRQYYVLDPERQKSCGLKAYSFKQYLMNMTYIKPEQFFYENKVGDNGVGPTAEVYLAEHNPQHVFSRDQVDKLFK